MKKLVFIISLLLINSLVVACPEYYRNRALLFYLGKMTNDDIGQVATFNFSMANDLLYSLEYSQELSPCNRFRHFLQPVVTSVDLRANVTLLDTAYGTLYEFNPYFALNWHLFPWCHQIRMIFSFGEGISYISQVPPEEDRFSNKRYSGDPKRILNFLLFELGFALPSYQWELLLRIHHRSGVFGFYQANNSGSTALGVAIRYRF